MMNAQELKPTSPESEICFPHIQHEGGHHFTDVLEDDAKLHGELKSCEFCGEFYAQNFWETHLEEGELEGTRIILTKLYRAYEGVIVWVSIAKSLNVEIGNPEEVQRVLNILWHNYSTNPFIRPNANPDHDDIEKYKTGFKFL